MNFHSHGDSKTIVAADALLIASLFLVLLAKLEHPPYLLAVHGARASSGDEQVGVGQKLVPNIEPWQMAVSLVA